MKDISIAWWNLENCFDHENAQRPPELKDWDAEVRDKKLDQLATNIN